MLMDLPDARSAYVIPNVNDHRPEDLARSRRHSTLAMVLENFREVVSCTNGLLFGRQ